MITPNDWIADVLNGALESTDWADMTVVLLEAQGIADSVKGNWVLLQHLDTGQAMKVTVEEWTDDSNRR